MIVGTRAQRIGDLSGAAFMTRTRTHKYGTVIFVMMSKGLTIDWMEFYISFTGLQIEKGIKKYSYKTVGVNILLKNADSPTSSILSHLK